MATRLLALLLVLSVFMPTLSHADIGGSTASQMPSTILSPSDTVPVHEGCGCIEGLRHGLYQHADVDQAASATWQPVSRVTYFQANEAARSLTPSPLQEPPKA